MVKKQYLIDTGLFIKYFRADRRAIKLLDNALLSQAISVFTITELLIGCKTEQEIHNTKEILQQYTLLQVTPVIAETTANIIKCNPDYFGKMMNRGVVDAFIAATAIEHRLTLVTLNRKHFEKLKLPGFNCVILRESEKNWHLI